jgi:hypothetical protein
MPFRLFRLEVRVSQTNFYLTSTNIIYYNNFEIDVKLEEVCARRTHATTEHAKIWSTHIDARVFMDGLDQPV